MMGYIKGGFVAICIAVLAGLFVIEHARGIERCHGFIEPCIGITPHRASNPAPYPAGARLHTNLPNLCK
jgi:hypothetical protein